MKSVTAAAFAAMPALAVAACSRGTDPAPGAGGSAEPAGSGKSEAPQPAPEAGKPLTDDDDLADATGAACR